MARIIAIITTIEPRSLSIITITKATADTPMAIGSSVFLELVCSDVDTLSPKNIAPTITIVNLISSAGWKDSPPICIHLKATPDITTTIIAAIEDSITKGHLKILKLFKDNLLQIKKRQSPMSIANIWRQM